MSVDADDPRFRPFFDAARDGRLAFPWCPACERFHWYPMPRCPHCRAGEVAWRDVDGAARLYSWSVVRHGFDEAWAAHLPYIVALVDIEAVPGIRLITNLVETAPDALAIDLPLAAVLPPADSADARVLFRPR